MFFWHSIIIFAWNVLLSVFWYCTYSCLRNHIDVEERLNRVERQLALAQDPRMEYFSDLIPSSSGRHPAASYDINTYYHNTCLFCGVVGTELLPVTKAHIVTDNSRIDYSAFGTSNGYATPLDVKSVRNFLPLCGVKGRVGSCHDAFDTYTIGMLYNPLTSKYFLFCLDHNFAKYEELNGKELTVDSRHQPYRRLLAWRSRRCAVVNGFCLKSKEEVDSFITLCEFSAASKSEVDEESDEDFL